ncbi:MAG: hypothetical protein ACXVGH_09000 [Mycobacteriales bacterium]
MHDDRGLTRGSADTRASASSLVRVLTVGVGVAAVTGAAGVAGGAAPHPTHDARRSVVPGGGWQDDGQGLSRQPAPQAGPGRGGPMATSGSS